jgi:ABC-type arginine transport system ATPase subunit
VADALSARMATMFDRPVAAADEAITADLVALLSALGR